MIPFLPSPFAIDAIHRSARVVSTDCRLTWWHGSRWYFPCVWSHLTSKQFRCICRHASYLLRAVITGFCWYTMLVVFSLLLFPKNANHMKDLHCPYRVVSYRRFSWVINTFFSARFYSFWYQEIKETSKLCFLNILFCCFVFVFVFLLKFTIDFIQYVLIILNEEI